MQAIQTPADPPNRGSRDLATIGCTTNSSAELHATHACIEPHHFKNFSNGG